MKITTVLLFVGFFQVFASTSYSQEGRLTVNLNDVPVESVLDYIESHSGYYFMYNEKLVDVQRKVDVSVKNERIDHILASVFDGTKVKVVVIGNKILLSPDQVDVDLVKKKLQQKFIITGTVKDEKGLPLPGVNIMEKGTSRGTITDKDGHYTLEVSSPDAVLVFSFVGYQKEEFPVAGKTEINVVMKEEAIGLQEVVAVGYGTQKKINLSGAVDQVKGDVLENRPVTNAARALQGVIPNLNITFGDGKPMRTAKFNVRGTTSIGAGGSALVLIDGVPGDPNLLNPGDIESVSVLKDAASAAIYGARGSFGVILITTKKAKQGKVEVSYSGNVSFKDRTTKPDLITDGYEWAKTFDAAYSGWYDYKSHPQKVNSVFPFSLSYLDELKRRHDDPSLPKITIDPTTGNYVYYGSTDWLKELYADNIMGTDHNITITGQKNKVGFYLSGHYSGQGGIFRYNPDHFKLYNLRAKESIQAFKWLYLANETSLSQRNYFTPILNHPHDTPVYRRVSDEAFPIAMLKNPDGTLTNNAAIVFGSFISGYNYQDFAKTEFINTTRFKSDITKKLSLSGDFTFRFSPSSQTSLYTPVPYSVKPQVMTERGESKMKYWDYKSKYMGLNIYANYENTFGEHSVKGLIGYNYENYFKDRLYLMRYDVINPELPDFSLIDGENFTMQGGGWGWVIIGGFFRFNYSYKDRYLLEVNGRYDGSSKFPPKQQFGFFPSISAAWRISDEPFFKKATDIVSNFKLRASYGSLGNGNVSPYKFLETMSVSRSQVIIGGVLPNKTQKPAVIPESLTWEKVKSVNGGIDLGFFKNKLSTSFDYYNRYTIGMYTPGMPLPAVFGASVPKGNYADLKTVGWEFMIMWRDVINTGKPIHYDVRFTLSDYVSHITKYNNPLYVISSYYNGYRIGDVWGYVNEGYFTDEDDILSHADQSYIRPSTTGTPLPGDIKFKDLNNDGKIGPGSSTLDDPGDRTIVGNSSPRYNFGVTANVDWNNFFFNIFFQGIGKRDYWPGKENSLFWGPYNRPYSFHPTWVEDEIWSEENPNTYFPRLRGYSAIATRGELRLVQSKYMQNAAYIRLKNFTFGYTLPNTILQKIKVSSLSVFITGENVWTYSPMFKHTRDLDPEALYGSDPETNSHVGNGMLYPILQSYSLGVNVKF